MTEYRGKDGHQMRIAIDLTALDDNFTGIERYALNMALEILRQDQQDTFELVFKNQVYPDFLLFQGRPNIRFHVLPGCGKLLFNQWRLPRFLNSMKADCCLFMAFPMPVLLRGRHIFGTIHDMGCVDCPETMKRQMVWYFRLSYWWMAKRAERIITISAFSRERIEKLLHVPEEKILLAYCGLSEPFQKKQELTDEERVRVRRKYGLPERYCLSLSTLEPRKNLKLLLDAYLEMYQSGGISTSLVLAGRKGWKIDELLEQAGAADAPVTVTGFVEDADLPVLYQMADCFVFPSLYEGFGIPPLEAMSQGVPVISSDAASMPEVLGGAARYFKSGDCEALKAALSAVGQDGTDGERIWTGMRRCGEFRYETGAGEILRNIDGL